MLKMMVVVQVDVVVVGNVCQWSAMDNTHLH